MHTHRLAFRSLAAAMLFAIARMMANRLGDHNKRFQRDVAAQFLWR